jgi:hypothetical protein
MPPSVVAGTVRLLLEGLSLPWRLSLFLPSPRYRPGRKLSPGFGSLRTSHAPRDPEPKRWRTTVQPPGHNCAPSLSHGCQAHAPSHSGHSGPHQSHPQAEGKPNRSHAPTCVRRARRRGGTERPAEPRSAARPPLCGGGRWLAGSLAPRLADWLAAR